MRKQNLKIRIKNFDEVALGYTEKRMPASSILFMNRVLHQTP